MANHGMRAPRGKSAYLDLPNESVSEKAADHLKALQDPDFKPYMNFDHVAAADDLRQIDAPQHIIDYHQGMADQGAGGTSGDSDVLIDKADQLRQEEQQ